VLRVHLLGDLRLDDGRAPVALPKGRPPRALLAWLALHPGRHARGRVAAALWPDVLDESARASLRTALSALRGALPDPGAVIAEREEIGLDAWVDVRELAPAELAEAGPLLPGLDDDWVLSARDEHRDRVSGALAGLARAAATLPEAVAFARARVTLDPLSEDAGRDLARRLDAAGDRGAALQALERLRERLHSELGSAPSAATRELAARLRTTALVSPPTAGGTGPIPLPPLLARAASAPLVGRSAELARVLALCERSAAGERVLGLVAGEAGIGKSRLAAEAARAAHARGATVLVGRCTEEPLAAYQPLVEALHHLVEQCGADVPAELGRLLPDVLPVPAGTGDRLRLFDAIRRLLDAVGPVVLLVDDIQWADAGTLLALGTLLRAPEPAPLLVLGTHRDVGETSDGSLAALLADLRRDVEVHRFALTGLDEPAVRAIVAGTLGEDEARRVAPRVAAETAGNPFFVREVARHLAESDEPGGVPEGVRDVLQRRLGRLSPSARTVLLNAAIAGREFEVATLEQLGDPVGEALLQALDEALHAGLVREEPGRPGAFAFAHALVRDALLDDLSAARLQALHARVAKALPADRRAAVAHHRAVAAPGDPHAAATASLAAARDAMAALAYEEAAAHATRGLAASGHEDPELLLALGDALLRTGDGAGSRTAFRRAADAATDAATRADAALGYGGLTVTVTHPDPTVVTLLQQARAAGPDDARRARLLARESIERYYESPAREQLSAQALELARATGDPGALVDALVARHVARWVPDGLDERLVLAEELVALGRETGDEIAVLKGLDWLVTDRTEAADVAGCRRAEQEFTALAEQLGIPAFCWLPHIWSAATAADEGRFDDVAAHLSDARRIGGPTGDPNVELFAGSIEEFTLVMLTGSFAAVDLALMERLAMASPVKRHWYCSLGWFTAARGETDAARVWVERCVDGDLDSLGVDMNWLSAMQELGEASAILGDETLARAIYDRLLPYAGRRITSMRAVTRLVVVDHALGRLAGAFGDLDLAARHLRRAVQRHRTFNWPPHVAASAGALAGVLEHRDGPGDAQEAATLRAELELLGAPIGVDVNAVSQWWWRAPRAARRADQPSG